MVFSTVARFAASPTAWNRASAVVLGRQIWRRPVARGRSMSTLTLSPPPPPQLFSGIYFTTTSILDAVLSWSTWFIKRTYQPSLVKRRRKMGLLKRLKSVGGRKVIKRRLHKKRKRIAAT